jgi:hypothetical protein
MCHSFYVSQGVRDKKTMDCASTDSVVVLQISFLEEVFGQNAEFIEKLLQQNLAQTHKTKEIEGKDSTLQKGDTKMQTGGATMEIREAGNEPLQKGDTTLQERDTTLQERDVTLQERDATLSPRETLVVKNPSYLSKEMRSKFQDDLIPSLSWDKSKRSEKEFLEEFLADRLEIKPV